MLANAGSAPAAALRRFALPRHYATTALSGPAPRTLRAPILSFTLKFNLFESVPACLHPEQRPTTRATTATTLPDRPRHRKGKKKNREEKTQSGDFVRFRCLQSSGQSKSATGPRKLIGLDCNSKIASC